jgi:UMP-CMP kinase
MDQLELFETALSPAVSAIFLDCPDSVRLPRLLDRDKHGNASRQDDDVKTIQKRFATFMNTTMVVIQYLRNDKRLITINAQQPPGAVLSEVERALGRLITLRQRD